MFGDFGHSSQRHRIPREGSPFGTFGRPSMSSRPFFGRRGWDDDDEGPYYQNHPQTFPTSTSSNEASGTGSHFERIIPIQVIGRPSPPPSSAANNSSTKEIPADKSTASTEEANVNSDPDLEKKYMRHNTTDILPSTLKVSQSDTQRAKSEPPMKINDAKKPSVPVESSSDANGSPKVTQFGAGISSKKKQEDANGVRNIPIIIEKKQGSATTQPNTSSNSSSNMNFGRNQQQSPQKNRMPHENECSTTPPPPPKKVTKDPLQTIQDVVTEVRNLEKEVNALPPTTKNAKNYLYLDEMLTRNLIKLDIIETEGKEDVRVARRDCIKLIQQVIGVLESKAQEDSTVSVNPSPDKIGSQQEGNSKNVQPSEEMATAATVDVSLTPSSTITVPEVATAEQSNAADPTSVNNKTSSNENGEEPMVVEETAGT